MKNFDYAKKYHYMLKYTILALPFLLLLFSIISMNSNITYFKDMLASIQEMINHFSSWSINSWYGDFLQLFNTTFDNPLLHILVYYPLYCLWVYAFDLFLDVFAMLPRLAHKFLVKFGGDY